MKVCWWIKFVELELFLDENRVCVGMCGKEFWSCWIELLAKETVCVCVVGEMKIWFGLKLGKTNGP